MLLVLIAIFQLGKALSPGMGSRGSSLRWMRNCTSPVIWLRCAKILAWPWFWRNGSLGLAAAGTWG